MKKTLTKAQKSDVLELDEMQHWLPGGWSLVARRKNKRWVWLASKTYLSAEEPARSSRTALADLEGAIGSRGEETCRLLWQRVPKRYKRCLLYSDFWDAYQKVLPDEQHEATGKGAGQTCHVERFNNILRQRLGRFVRKTLSFSKCDLMHELCLRLFLHEHNKHCLR